MDSKLPVLEVKNVSKTFNNIKALVDVSMRVYQGEVLALVGDNGAGKSTLIKTLSGVIKPDTGTITVLNETYDGLTTSKAIECGISTVYQDLALGDTMNSAANIFLGRELTKFGMLDKTAMRRKAEELLKDLEIKISDVTIPAGDLSGGQRQGVAVARLINSGGSIFIFDEPTAAMGITESNSVLRLIHKLADNGYTVILISHNLAQVMDISDRIYVMKNGRISPEMITSSTTSEEITKMITAPEEIAYETNY